MSATFDDPEAARADLPVDVLAFVQVVEYNVEKGDGGADTKDTLTLCRIVREQAARIEKQRRQLSESMSLTDDAQDVAASPIKERDALRERLAEWQATAAELLGHKHALLSRLLRIRDAALLVNEDLNHERLLVAEDPEEGDDISRARDALDASVSSMMATAYGAPTSDVVPASLRERLAKLEALVVRAHRHLFDEGTAEDCECRGCTLYRDLTKELLT